MEFHSKNIADTKAHEKREVFVNVEQKKTIKQSAEEFQRKFAAAKAHAAESRAKIENPGADANGVIRSHVRRPFPTKLALKIGIPVLLLAGAGLAIYLNWPAIYHEFFEVSEEKANELLSKNLPKAIEIYDKLLVEQTDQKTKAFKYLAYSEKIEESCSPECSTETLAKIKEYITASESLNPTYASANLMYSYELNYGDSNVASEWEEKMNVRQASDKTGGLGNG